MKRGKEEKWKEKRKRNEKGREEKWKGERKENSR
jgi:hypothetical protein